MSKVSAEEAARLESNMNVASSKLRKDGGLTMSGGGATAEVQYGIAYQQLVQAGLRPQLKEKYR